MSPPKLHEQEALAAISRALKAGQSPGRPPGTIQRRKHATPPSTAPETAPRKRKSKGPVGAGGTAEAALPADPGSAGHTGSRKKRRRKDGLQGVSEAPLQQQPSAGSPEEDTPADAVAASDKQARKERRRQRRAARAEAATAAAAAAAAAAAEGAAGGEDKGEGKGAERGGEEVTGEEAADVTFRELYVGAVTDALEAELRLQAKEAEGRGVSVGALLHCLDLGVDVFSPLEQQLSVRSVRQRSLTAAKARGLPLTGPSPYQELFGWL